MPQCWVIRLHKITAVFDFEVMQRIYEVNTVWHNEDVGSVFSRMFRISDQKKIVAITSLQGSIAGARDPLIPFYKMSKTALNMGMKNISRRVKKQEYYCRADLTGSRRYPDDETLLSIMRVFKGGFLITPQESAEAVINIIDQYDFNLSGTFMSHRGDVIPW